MKRVAQILFAVVWLVGVTAHGAATEEKVIVKVATLPSKQSTSPQAVGEYRILERFQQLHPNIQLVPATSLRLIGDAMDAGPLMAIAGGTSPDIIYVNFRQSDTYISQGFLVPLDDYVKRMSPQEYADRVPESMKPVIRRKGPDGQEHYYVMPQQACAMVLLYRRDLFAAAGLDPDRPPQNWVEYKEYCEKLTDPKRGIYGASFLTGQVAAWGVFAFISSAGAHAVEQDAAGEWRATFDTPEAVTAYHYIDDLMKSTITKDGQKSPIVYRTAGSDFHSKWSDGKVAMMFSYLAAGQLGNFDPQLIGVAAIPKGPTGISSAEVNARMSGIFAGQKDERVREAAWEWLRFQDSIEAREIFTRTMVERGAWRMLSPSWLKRFGFSTLARLAPPGLEQAFDTALEQGTPEPYGKNCQYVYDFMSKPIEKIYYELPPDLKPEAKRVVIQEILRDAVRETNEKMLGLVPAEVRGKRNRIAWVVAVGVLISFVVLLMRVFGWMSAGPVSSEPTSPYKNRLAIMLIAPALLLILMWQYYPLVRGSAMAFQDYSVMGGSPWVGLNNFADVLFDSRFWLSLRNALYFCALWMVLGFLPPVFLAVMLQEIPVGKIFYRVLFYLPAVVSGVVILLMWTEIYDQSPAGLLNKILAFFNIPPQTWLQDPKLAMLCVVFPLAWAGIGPGSIIYLAALKGIPEELYEAADIDGSSFFDKLRYIVLPYLRPLLLINVVGATIFGFKSGDAILAMTGGGPNLATHVVGYEIFQRTYLYLHFSQGAAMAWILGVLLLAFTAYQLRILNKVEFRTTTK